MANVYVGFHDQRSCNRILKPPGGGSSNIFGTDRLHEIETPKFEKAGSVQEALQSETVTIKTSFTDQNGATHTETSTEIKTEQSGTKIGENGTYKTDEHFENVAKESDVTVTNGTTSKHSLNDITDKIENIAIQEQNQDELKNGVVEVDSTSIQSETTTVVSSAMELKSSKSSTTSSTIADVLSQDGVAVKDVDVPKKEKPKTPNRVPPGGFSSGLW